MAQSCSSRSNHARTLVYDVQESGSGSHRRSSTSSGQAVTLHASRYISVCLPFSVVFCVCLCMGEEQQRARGQGLPSPR